MKNGYLMFGYGGMMGPYGPGSMMNPYGYGAGYGYGGMFIGLLFWIVIIVLAYFLIKSLIEKNKTQGVVGRSALDIAKER